LIRNRPFLSALVIRAGEAIREYARVLQEVADVIVILAPSECTISRKMYEATSKEPVQQLVETVASDPEIASFFHLCTRNNEHIMNEEIIAPLARAGLTGLNVPNVLGAIPLAQALDLVVLGGIDPVGVQQFPWQEVLQQTRVILEQTREIRFILGTDCHLMKIPRLEPSGTLLTKFLELNKLLREFSQKSRVLNE
jgi:uroporphyrinogen-III decarboxylase